MKSWKTPTPEQVDKAVSLLGRSEQYRYFFDRLENPLWLGPLSAKRFFKNPPVALRNEKEGTVTFPPWPESQYLARMAKLPEAQEDVLQIALGIPDTDNVRVHEDLVDIALALPPEMAVQFVPKAKAWLESPYQLLLPEKVGQLVAHLARAGELEDALQLCRSLLWPVPDPRSSRPDEAAEKYLRRPEPHARFDPWQYKKVLAEYIPPLVDAAGVRALNLLCDVLESALALSQRPGEELAPEDLSYIWRPAIEDHGQNNHGGIKDELVSAVRDAAERIGQRDLTSVRHVIGVLEARRWRIFRRVALYVLRRLPEAAPDLVAERLTDRSLFDEVGLRHEYFLLEAECFSQLRKDEQNTILQWIEKGPDIEQFKDRHERFAGERPSDAQVEQYVKVWRRDRLAPLAGSLPAEWQRRYEELVAELGPADRPEFPVYTSAWSAGPASPKTADELASLSIDHLVTFLSTWKPSGDWQGPTPEGLGAVLQRVVAANPAAYADGAARFKGLEPTYVRGVTSGLRDAIREKKPFAWQPVLDLCRWVLEQPQDVHDRPYVELDADPDWRWTRKGIADLISAGFEEGETEVPAQLRDNVWQVLSALTEDPDPTPQHEAEYGGDNMDPATLSINTTRGEAMHAAMRYGLWVRRHLEAQPDADVRLARGLEEMPELRGVLELHLDPEREPSLAIRAVYGQWFPWLVLLDTDWAKSQVGKIFPTDPSQSPYRDAAWNTYITFCPVYDAVFEVLRGEYARAVERMDQPSAGAIPLRDPHERLAEHLMILYWRGHISVDDKDSLLAQFFDKADDSLRAQAIEFIGRSLRSTEGEIDQPVLDRLQALWLQRLSATAEQSHQHREELAAFGWWFISQKFDLDWSLEQLREVLHRVRRAEPDHVVVETLAEVAGSRPAQAVECLAAMVEGYRDSWQIIGWRESVEALLGTAMRADDSDARRAARNLIDQLGALGHLEYRQLLG